ncbi:glycine--tRNA ligase [Candidatus Marsarchaeota archaeon]|nr:glycine--tRNA ligase [Candidatus Marsarchaeota archaeon]MCL5405099.1 glycine--tRNA ligase [Candidatus Marsarchaeota archaeon]
MDRVSFEEFENLVVRRGIIIPSFQPYGELAGFYDYGPIGMRIRNRIEHLWRRIFIDGMGNLEISTTLIAPEQVFNASGHLKNFTDPIVVCTKCHTPYRADKLIEEFYASKNELAPKQSRPEALDEIISKNKIRCPKCGGELSKVEQFNLMMATKVGPYNAVQGYLRPETAQGIFLDFKQIFRDGGYKLPIGVGQVGKAFRNEISPRRMLIRMREFNQMELEYFFDPEEKDFEINFRGVDNRVLDEEINILTKEMQESGSKEAYKRMSIRQCIDKGFIPNRLFAFLVHEEKKFMEALGFDDKSFRFRDLVKDELPHYSRANFDLEVEFFGSYEEVCGTAYRTDFDLSNHAKFSGEDMSIISNNKKLVPHVVEVSFGLDRLFWTLSGHRLFKDEKRSWYVLALNEATAPYDYALFPLQKDEEIIKKAARIQEHLLSKGLTVFFGSSGSIGKRYAKADEVGIVRAITVDFDTLKDDTVTIRDSIDAKQRRLDYKLIK